MNPISYALKQLRYSIPIEILEKVFVSSIWHRANQPISLDARIREDVIEDRVLPDCNLKYGQQMTISLIDLPKEQVDLFMWVYRIPKFKTQGRTIVRALNVSFGDGTYVGTTSVAPMQGNALLEAATGVFNAASPIPIVSTANVQIIGENVILIQDNMALPVNVYLRCWVENDANMNHIQPTSYSKFAEMVELAVKAHIWVKCQIPMDRAFIFSGAELGRFGSIIDSYAEANEMYKTFREERWGKIAIMNDRIAHDRIIRRNLGGLN